MPSFASDSLPTWAEARTEALARLAAGVRGPLFYRFHEQLLDACADVLAESGGRDLVFLGRSPENVFDLLRALLSGVRHGPKLTLLPFSCRVFSRNTACTLPVEAVAGFERHMTELGLDLASVASSESGVCVVDCVCWGTTFANFEDLIALLALARDLDPKRVMQKVRYLGLTKKSLGWTHWKHDEESRGAEFFREGRARAVPISSQLWRHLADSSPKTTESYTPEGWTSAPVLPGLGRKSAAAARLTGELLIYGWARDVRRAFAGKLSQRAGRERAWLRSLVVELLRSTRRKVARR